MSIAPEVVPPPVAPTRVPVWGTVRDALGLVLRNPREAMLPTAVIHVPAALASAVVTVVLYFTAFEDQDFIPGDELISEGASGALFVFLALAAFEGLFAQVARGATIVSIAGVITGNRRTLTASLDPAFTRMGGLLVLAILFATGAVLLALSLVGLVLIPFLALRFALAFEVYMLEGLGPAAAMRRSWGLMSALPQSPERPAPFITQIVSGYMLRLLGVLLAAAVIAAIPLVAVTSLTELVTGDRSERILISGAVTFVQALLLAPVISFVTATTTLFYLRLRAVRNEPALARN